MKLYRIDRKSRRLSDMEETDAYSERVLETNDLENWIASGDQRELFRRPILWIRRQDRPTDSDRSDLLGIDDAAQLVLLELKRGTVKLEPLWSFTLTLCGCLNVGENPVTPEDAWWLGLIDEVVGTPLARRRIPKSIKSQLLTQMPLAASKRFY